MTTDPYPHDQRDQPYPEDSAAGVASVQRNSAEHGGTVNAVQYGTLNHNQYASPHPHEVAARHLSHWEKTVRRLTSHSIVTGREQDLVLSRADLLNQLIASLSGTGDGQAVIVRGEPGVGKSALALRAVDRLRADSASVFVAPLQAMSRQAGALEDILRGALDGRAVERTTRRRGLLVLDGAEAAQEGDAPTLMEAVDAAAEADLTPVLVTRDDAVENLRELLEQSGCDEPVEFVVPPLNEAEIGSVVDEAPELARLARDPRARWLLRRLTVIDLLLRSVRHGAVLPAVLSSEAEVYAIVWRTLILNSHRTVDGVSSDDRGSALVSLAEGRLTGCRVQLPPGPALSSLRSDGVLAPLGEEAAFWEEEQRFAHDVLRDFATARRLMVGDGLPLLDRKGPRWALRAARIVCQARLGPAATTARSFVNVWRQAHGHFEELAARHGSRWAEVPWEAVLSASWCADALMALTDDLRQEPRMLAELIQCASLRFGGDSGGCDPLVAAPVVAWLCRHTSVLTDARHSPQDEAANTLVVAWLRAVSLAELSGIDIAYYRPVRESVRDRLLDIQPRSLTPEAVEALALLGTDRDAAADAVLRDLVARQQEYRLVAAVDRVGSAWALARTNPALLRELAKAYYCTRRDGTTHGRGRGIATYGHEHEYLGPVARKRAAWTRGPFYALLRSAPEHGIALVRDLLNTAVHMIGHDRYLGPEESRADTSDDVCRLEGDFVGTGPDHYPGSEGAWSWYRGTLNGPQPCASALMAVERCLEPLIQDGVMSPGDIAALILRRVGTAAGAGLAYGFLVRHLDQVTDELDGFLANPLVWSFENTRTGHEQLFKRGSDLHGGEGLLRPPAQVAMLLVNTAGRRGDDSALGRLQAVANRLRAAAECGPDELDPLAVKGWADHLDWERYRAVRDGDHLFVEVEPAADIAEELERRRARASHTSELYRLLNRYRPRTEVPHRVDPPEQTSEASLMRDLKLAQRIVGGLEHDAVHALDGVYAIAAAAVHAAVTGDPPEADDFHWAIDLLAGTLDDDPTNESSHATYPWRADRQAAFTLPRALLPAVTQADPALLTSRHIDQVIEAVHRGAAHPLNEVRVHSAEGIRPLWASMCLADDQTCQHAVAWSAVEGGLRFVLRDARAGDESPAATPPPSLAAQFDRLTGKDVEPVTLATAASAVLEAAHGRHCRVAEARVLRTSLLRAYVRSAHAWDRDHYDLRSDEQTVFAAALLRTALTESRVPVDTLQELAAAPGMLGDLLEKMKQAATYEPDLIPAMAIVWPHIMSVALAACSETSDDDFAQHDRDRLMAAVLPDPTPHGADTEIDESLKRARRHWLVLGPLTEPIELWTRSAVGTRFAVDNLIGFLKAQSAEEQVDPGLRWARQLAIGPDGAVFSTGFLLTEWLGELRPVLTDSSRPHYHALLDALALAGDSAARELQKMDE
ncbi:NACHT domain-containing protein [Streptomyces sp. NPDC056909]|uniref:NACHT domain-containing protein n=1 Tax=Streptomyces sp. NPDC056909 TaxID=3345963 RepID=UPI0036C1317C